MPDIHTLGITTAFVPPTTCLAPSNLWLTTVPCGTQWPDDGALGAPFTDALDPPTCTVTVLGPPDLYDADCYAGYYHPAVNDCPVGMTAAWETTDIEDGVKYMATRCCPSAYEFTSKVDAVPPAGEDSYPTFVCRADNVKSLSGQTVTLTVSTEPLITTEVAWDYDKDYIYAYTDRLSRHVYEGPGTTSECFGFDCPYSNPLVAPTPTPTPTPTSSYIPPPSHPTTQFTPDPSCISSSHMYLVSTSCQILADDGPILTPDWLECSITEFGEWNTQNDACFAKRFPDTKTTGDDGTASFYAGCPVGYTTASESTYRPYDKGQYESGTTLVTESFDVVVTSVGCCPTGDYSFKFSDVHTTSTSRPGGYEYVDMYPMPRCVVQYVKALSGKDVELTLAANNAVMDKRKRQEATQGPEVTTRPWADDAFLFAEAEGAAVTVFHGTYSCYESCDEYFTSSYNNTDPNYSPTSTAASSTDEAGEGQQGEATQANQGGATQSSQGEATQTSQGEATPVSGTSGTMTDALLRQELGAIAFMVFQLSFLY